MHLLRLQEQNGSGHLFVVEIPDWGEIPFKLPSVRKSREYAAAIFLSEDENELCSNYEYIFRECVVDPDIAFDLEIPAGIPQSVAELILLLSGALPDELKYTEDLINTFRSQLMEQITLMKRVICSVFSGYTFESLGELDYQDLVEVFTNAEHIMLEAGLLEAPYHFSVDGQEPSRPPKQLHIPIGPTGMPGPNGPAPMPSSGPSDNTPMKPSGGIDIDALVRDGHNMERFDSTAPAKGAHNLHDDPAYKAKKEAVLEALSRRGGR